MFDGVCKEYCPRCDAWTMEPIGGNEIASWKCPVCGLEGHFADGEVIGFMAPLSEDEVRRLFERRYLKAMKVTPSREAIRLMPKGLWTHYTRMAGLGEDIEVVSDTSAPEIPSDVCPACGSRRLIAWTVKSKTELECKKCGHLWW